MYHCIGVFIKPWCARIVLAAHNLFSQSVKGFHETVVPGIHLVCMALVAMLAMHFVAVFKLLFFIYFFINFLKFTCLNLVFPKTVK